MNVIIKSELKTVRQIQKVSVRKLADISGVSKTFISDIENNHKIPTIYTLCILAVCLKVKPEDLYTYKVVGRS